MAGKHVSVKMHLKQGSEASYFAERDEKLLRELRETAAREANKKYSDEHRDHCFR